MSGLAIGHMTPGVIVDKYLSRMWEQREASLTVTFECANVHLVEIRHVLFTQGLSIRRLECLIVDKLPRGIKDVP